VESAAALVVDVAPPSPPKRDGFEVAGVVSVGAAAPKRLGVDEVVPAGMVALLVGAVVVAGLAPKRLGVVPDAG
jgi:hypothetical protein